MGVLKVINYNFIFDTEVTSLIRHIDKEQNVMPVGPFKKDVEFHRNMFSSFIIPAGMVLIRDYVHEFRFVTPQELETYEKVSENLPFYKVQPSKDLLKYLEVTEEGYYTDSNGDVCEVVVGTHLVQTPNGNIRVMNPYILQEFFVKG
jgi:hypothetical protein